MDTSKTPTHAAAQTTDPLTAVYIARRSAQTKADAAKLVMKTAEAQMKAALKAVESADSILIPVLVGGPKEWAGDLVYLEKEVKAQRAACGPIELVKLVLARDPLTGLAVQADYDKEIEKQKLDIAANPILVTVVKAKALAAPRAVAVP